MDRVPYRRVMPSRSGTGEYDYETNEAISHGETLILQCIISSIILAFILVAGMIDIAPAAALRGGVQQVLTGAHTLDELVTDVRRFGTEWLGWEPVEDAVILDEYIFPANEYLDDNRIIDLETHIILDELESDYPEAADDQASNQTVPEPPDTPGLWD